VCVWGGENINSGSLSCLAAL